MMRSSTDRAKSKQSDGEKKSRLILLQLCFKIGSILHLARDRSRFYNVMRLISSILIILLVLSSLSFAQTNRNLEREKPTGSQAERRVALVIGNGAYQKAKTCTESGE